MNGFDLSTISGIFVGGTEYSAIYKGSSLIWQSGPHDYSQDYLTFESLEDNNVIGWKKSSSDAPTGTIQYSTDKTTWTSVTPDTTGVTLATLNTGDKLYLKGDNNAYGNYPSNTNRWINFTSTKTFNMYGNIMSLLNSTNFRTMTTLPAVNRTFSNIFLATKVVDASNLILPATAVTFVGYYCMFKNCTELTTPPVLPATSLNMYCYQSMFEGCSKLATPPVLPATSLANYCYQSMFKGCTSLTSIPNNYLPATSLSMYCYNSMFYGCTSLTSVPSLPATTLILGCYYLMFYNCTSLTAAPELPAITLATQCYREMFENCTSLNSAPELPATTLAQNCYRGMFQNCSNITTAPELPATTLVDACYRSMFYGCSKLNYIKMLATDISALSCLNNWVNGVASTGTFVKDANTTMSTGSSGIPSGWTVQNIDNTVKDNASITVYDNYQTGTQTQYNVISTLDRGTNRVQYGSDQSAFYYGKGKHIQLSCSNGKITMTIVFKLNMVITGFTEFKVDLVGNLNSSAEMSLYVGKINDDTTISYGDLVFDTEHLQAKGSYSSVSKVATYSNLDPNTKYNITIHLKVAINGYGNTYLIMPNTYPNATIKNAYFSSSADYTEIYGS